MKSMLVLILALLGPSAFAAEPFSCQGKDGQGENVVLARDQTGVYAVKVNDVEIYGMAGFVWVPTLNPLESKYYNFEVDHSTISFVRHALSGSYTVTLDLNIFSFETHETTAKHLELQDVVCS